MNVKLVVVQGKPAGRKLRFGPGEYYLGRGPECHVRFNSDWVSRQHCLLRVTDADVSLRDLGSRNGTLINGGLLHGEHSLNHADQIQIGPVVFEVRLEAPEMEITHHAAATGDTLFPEEGDEAPKTDATANHPLFPLGG